MNPYQNHMDTELVALLRDGDPRAFEAIYRRYAKDLFGYALARVRIREDCEEMVHDVFEALWKRREDVAITSLKHYLFTSVRYMVIRYISHRGVRRKFEDHFRLFERVYESIEENGVDDPSVIRAQLLQHVNALPERCREAIRLRLTENLSNGEIAERMNINKSTVQLYISKAFSHLRGSYDKIFRTAE